MQSILTPLLLALLFLYNLEARSNPWSYNVQDHVARTIVVDKDGKGQFTSVQQAINSVPSNNPTWIKIRINYGIYTEKVEISKDKPYIILDGDANRRPEIQFGIGGSVTKSPTFKAHADNFVARNIVFKNTYDKIENLMDADGNPTTWAVALSIDGDKQSFYNCRMQSLQDTLTDAVGRHYFNGCTIEGAIDFIWNIGQSLYEKCEIVSLTDKIGGSGYITAQGRDRAEDPSAFVFKDCKISGSGPVYLGRAYGKYSTVLFFGTYMEDIVAPEGWAAAWNTGHEDTISYSEVNCSGPGANMSRRVPWMKKLSNEEVMRFTNAASFIDQDGWIGKQPN